MSRIELILGDITRVDADAIVNAANHTLLGGGGVDGAIHRAAGPGLLEECRLLNGCATGEAKITGGYNLKARFVIHTVGPVWYGGTMNEPGLLESCYVNSLKLAASKQLGTIAFPGISTGIFGYPRTAAAEVAMTAVKNWLENHTLPGKVIFVLFDKEYIDIYKRLLS